MKRGALKGLTITCLMTILVTAVSAKTEYISLTARGNEMAPAIWDGDTVKVKICTDGSLIKSCSSTDPNSGDIIVYCAAAVVPYPASMFTVGRVTHKYFADGHWCFETKLDNQTEPNPWEVRETALLGVVEEVIHNGGSSAETDSQDESQAYWVDPGFGLPSMPAALADLLLGMVIGLVTGFAVKEAFSEDEPLTELEHRTRSRPRTVL
jgi:hypothetical protein